MTLYLRERALSLTERMDDPHCDPEKLARTYAQFARINALLSGWTGIYRRELRPALQSGARTVLDIGCGGGDVLRHLAKLTQRDGLSAEFRGIDPDPRAIAFAQAQHNPANLHFEQADLYTLASGADILLSNHVLHHLTPHEIQTLCTTCERLAGKKVIHNDLRRDDRALVLFPFVGSWFHSSFIFEDGMRSIRRAFTEKELEKFVPPGWQVTPSAPFRLQLQWRA